MTDILMPALSPTMEEGVLAKWNIKQGDTVQAGDVIAEIETDKATMEVEAVDEGVVEAILVPAGTEGVRVNTPIARLRGEGENTAAPSSPPVTKPISPGPPSSPPRFEAAPSPAAAEPEPAKTSPTSAASSPRAVNGVDAGARIFASPLARRIAAQRGVDIRGLKGSGPHGRVIRSDVEAAPVGGAKAAPASNAASQARGGELLSLEQMGIPTGSYDLLPLDGMKKTIARRMTESFRNVPHFPLTIDLEIDRLLDARARINGALERQGVKVSVNDIIIKACALALKAVPQANASFTPEGLAMHHHADVAVAVAIDGGLITPIVRQAENLGLAEISKVMKDLADRARNRKLKPEEFQGGTFSLSNLGMMGIKSFASIINEPQGCILSVGAGEERPVVKNGVLAVATVMTITLTCDHRVVDGAVGARWLGVFKGLIEDPVIMLA